MDCQKVVVAKAMEKQRRTLTDPLLGVLCPPQGMINVVCDQMSFVTILTKGRMVRF